jgi:cell division protein FtsB
MWKTISKIVINKYFITLLVFVIYMIFFDDHNIRKRQQQEEEMLRLEKEKEFYQKEISKNLETEKLLNSDTILLEKIAREQYYMKKPNEDVFLFARTDTAGC